MNVPGFRDGLHLPNQAEAVVRHRDVRYQNMRPDRRQEPGSLLRRGGGRHQRPAVFQRNAQELARVLGILDHQDMNAYEIAQGHGVPQERSGALTDGVPGGSFRGRPSDRLSRFLRWFVASMRHPMVSR